MDVVPQVQDLLKVKSRFWDFMQVMNAANQPTDTPLDLQISLLEHGLKLGYQLKGFYALVTMNPVIKHLFEEEAQQHKEYMHDLISLYETLVKRINTP